MITDFQHRLSESRDMTIFGKRSLQNRKLYLNTHNFLFSHLISTKRTFLESSYQDLSNDVSFDSIR